MAELTVMVELGGRDIEMRRATEASMIVLARVFRGIPKIENVEELGDEQRAKLVSNLGTIGKVVESMIVKEDDLEWLDDAMIDGLVTAEEAIQAITRAEEKFNGGSKGPKKAAKSVRRAQ